MTRIAWSSRGFNLDKKPYLAILEGLDEKYTFRRRFISKSWKRNGVTVRDTLGIPGEEDETEWTHVGASFSGGLDPGTILEARECHSTGHGTCLPIVSYYTVNDGGLHPIGRTRAKLLLQTRRGW